MSPSTIKRAVAAVGVTAILAPAGVIAVAEAATTKTVKLNAVTFSPSSVTIKKNDRIKFRWVTGTHNLRGPGVNVSPKDSGTKTVTFKKRGSFTFVCDLHSGMKTKIRVK